MKAKSKTTSPKRKTITMPAPRNWSFFSYNPTTHRTYYEDFFDTHQTYSDDKRIQDSVDHILEVTKTPHTRTPILEKYFADDMLEAARAGNMKAVKAMNQLLPGSILFDPVITRQIEKHHASTLWLQKVFAPKKRKRQKYSFTLTHLGIFIDMYDDIVFLRELRDQLNGNGCDPQFGQKEILKHIPRLADTATIHPQWIDAIFNDKKFNRAIDRAAFIYGDITGWKSIRKYIPKYLNWKSIQPAFHKYAVEQASVTANAWLSQK